MTGREIQGGSLHEGADSAPDPPAELGQQTLWGRSAHSASELEVAEEPRKSGQPIVQTRTLRGTGEGTPGPGWDLRPAEQLGAGCLPESWDRQSYRTGVRCADDGTWTPEVKPRG